MAKTSWAEVKSSTTSRRAAGADTEQNRCPRSNGSMMNIFRVANDPLVASILGGFDTQSTLALGLVYSTSGCDLIAARKSVSEGVLININALKQRLLPQGDLLSTDAITAGLHAEMAIVRYCLYTLGIAKHDLYLRLQIVCIGKKVCKDCAGWMNAHFIGHCSVLPGVPPTVHFECGSVSTMGGGIWESPRTGAVYSGGNGLNHYSKNGTTINKPFYE